MIRRTRIPRKKRRIRKIRKIRRKKRKLRRFLRKHPQKLKMRKKNQNLLNYLIELILYFNLKLQKILMIALMKTRKKRCRSILKISLRIKAAKLKVKVYLQEKL